MEREPYGKIYATVTGAARHQPLAFPGQEDDGSAVSYNIFRWYRAGWGQYAQADPLERSDAPKAFFRDANVYRYGLSNPLTVIDALGLGVKYGTLNQAASDAITDICPLCRRMDKEYFGYICRSHDGEYFYSRPQQGLTHKAPVDERVMDADAVVGMYHCHGDYSEGYDDENFGPGDKRASRVSQNPVYLVTPSGTMKRFAADPPSNYGGPGVETLIGHCPCAK